MFPSVIFSQVYDQSYFLNKLPKIPEKIVGVTEEEKEAFNKQLESVKRFFDSVAVAYKHPMCPLEKSKQSEMFEHEQIWLKLNRFHDEMANLSIEVATKMGELSLKEGDKMEKLAEKRRAVINESLKTLKSTVKEENAIHKEQYDVRASYCNKRAEMLTSFIKRYKAGIEMLVSDTKRADSILLPSIMVNAECAALYNADMLLVQYSGYLSLFLEPYTPKF
jgi:hypothetical protein